MFNLVYGNTPKINKALRLNASTYIRNYLLNNSEQSRGWDLNEERTVKEIIRHIEATIGVNLKNNEGDLTEPNKIKLTYTKSNLGKGFVFWFVCNICGRRVKYLYFPSSSSILACRRCHKLTY